MPTLVEKRTELQAAKEGLKKIFDAMGPEYDATKAISLVKDAKTTKDVTDEIQRQNKALEGLATTVEMMAAGELIKRLEEEWDKPATGRIPFPGGDGKTRSKFAGKSLGEVFTESAAFKTYSKARKAGDAVEIDIDDENELKRLLGVGTKATLTETGYAPQAIRTGLILPGALRRPVVADLIPDGTTRMNAIVYMEETTTTNAAATVAEGAAKPESTLVFTERSSPVRKIATVLPITDELMDDEPAMRSYVEARLRLFLALAEEAQLYAGSGVSPDLTGLTITAGINTQAKGADPTPDAIWKAMDLIRVNAFLEPDGVIMHPNDWQDIRLLRTADGIYIWGSPSEQGPQRIWGVPVVVTPAATQNTGLVGAFAQGTQIFRRSQVSFAVSDQHQDFFIKNLLMLRVEERLALVVYRPKGLSTVTGI
jgi:HK97 family phage major capsid protein